MLDRVTITTLNGVADVRLNRPDKMNALDLQQFEAIARTIEIINATKSIRCVVLSGEGRSFCGGVDLHTLSDGAALRDLVTRTHGHANLFQHAAWGWRKMSVPVIAAVHGVALGGGFQMMLGADIRVVAPDAQLSMLEARWGLIPDMAGIALLRGLVRDDVAREITYTGRRFSGVEAAALGLATHVDANPHERAMTLAREIATKSPAAVRAGKRLLNMGLDNDAADILLAESQEEQVLLNSPGHFETLASYLENRTPVFDD